MLVAAQSLLVIALQALGLGILAPLYQQQKSVADRSDWLWSAGLFVGAAFFSLVYVLVLMAFRGVAALLIAVCLSLMVSGFELYRTRAWQEYPVKFLALMSALSSMLVWYCTVYNRSISSYDSIFYYFSIGEVIPLEGLWRTDFAAPRIASAGFFYSLFHSIAVLGGFEFFPALLPVFAAHLFLSMVLLIRHEIASTVPGINGTLIALIGVLPIVLSSGFLFHSFYINHHLLFAGCFLWAVYLLLLSIRTDSNQALVVAVLLCAGLLLMRVEARLQVPLLGIFFWAHAAGTEHRAIGRKCMILLAVLVMAFCLLEYAVVADSPSLFINDTRRVLLLAAMAVLASVGGLAMCNSVGRVEPSLRLLPTYVFSFLAVFLALVVITTDGEIPASLFALIASGFLGTATWSFVWWYVAALILLGSVVAASIRRDAEFILLLVGSLVLMLPFLTFLRGLPFHTEWTDSGTRILFHFLPSAVVFGLVRIFQTQPNATSRLPQ